MDGFPKHWRRFFSCSLFCSLEFELVTDGDLLTVMLRMAEGMRLGLTKVTKARGTGTGLVFGSVWVRAAALLGNGQADIAADFSWRLQLCEVFQARRVLVKAGRHVHACCDELNKLMIASSRVFFLFMMVKEALVW